MSTYELMVLLVPTIDDKDVKKIEEIVNDLVAPGQGKITELTVLGKKTLAYLINKQTEGVYAVAKVSGIPLKLESLSKVARQKPEVLRFLLTHIG